MKKLYPVLKNCLLFDGIHSEHLIAMLECLGARRIEVPKGGIIFREGDAANDVGIVLEGSVHLIREDFYGNRSIVTHINPGELFAETYACAGVKALPVSVIASEDCKCLLIDCKRITVSCTNACEFHNRVIFNLLRIVANKNIVFDQKIEVTSKRSTREKLMAYLMGQAKTKGTNEFIIPYDRQQLADYLEVDRSGLSAEISKLKKEGIIDCEKNRFVIL